MMAANNILPQEQDKPIRNATIEITKRTVKFGSDVYQFRNVTGFGISPVKTANLVPLQFILVMFVLGLLLANVPDFRMWGIILVLLAIAGFIANNSQPKSYGLKLYLNSGSPSPVFITTDMQGLGEVVSDLYKIMETNEERTYRINIVEGNVEGNFIGGDALGDVLSRIRK
jgi:hypothetical protein